MVLLAQGENFFTWYLNRDAWGPVGVGGGLGQRNGVPLEKNLGKNIFSGTLFFPLNRKKSLFI